MQLLHHFLCRNPKVGHIALKLVELNLNNRKIE
jgi:hypothetical protein